MRRLILDPSTPGYFPLVGSVFHAADDFRFQRLPIFQKLFYAFRIGFCDVGDALYVS